MDIIVKEQSWTDDSLLKPNGYKCCLGFAAKQIIIENGDDYVGKDFIGKDYPSGVGIDDFRIKPSKGLVDLFTKEINLSQYADPYNWTLEALLGEINDKYHGGEIDLKTTLHLLQKGFKEAGHTLVFIPKG